AAQQAAYLHHGQHIGGNVNDRSGNEQSPDACACLFVPLVHGNATAPAGGRAELCVPRLDITAGMAGGQLMWRTPVILTGVYQPALLRILPKPLGIEAA